MRLTESERIPDTIEGQKVSTAKAHAVWVPAARELLISTAQIYNNWITYADLAERIQQITGVSTKQPLQYWIGGLLDAVSIECEQRGEPHLTALCVHSDQSIGDGYPWARADATEVEREEVAAKDRFHCYQVYADDLPDDGGSPTLTPSMQSRFQRQRRSTPTPAKQCPICFMELPSTGICNEDHS